MESQPVILTRAQWGADESIRTRLPSYSSTIKAGFVHHTVNANSYSVADVPAVMRGIYAYHVKSNGWSDIGYNFLIDRFGRTWEGRYGGITRAVIGAHTGGFNTDTFAASLLGTYSTTAPPQVTMDARRVAVRLEARAVLPRPAGQGVAAVCGRRHRQVLRRDLPRVRRRQRSSRCGQHELPG